jgi:hypothetical protein
MDFFDWALEGPGHAETDSGLLSTGVYANGGSLFWTDYYTLNVSVDVTTSQHQTTY